MARQRGLIRVKGSVGDTSYYKSQDGWLVREKGEFDALSMATSPRYARVRENLKEFGSSAKSGKLLRDSFKELLFVANDSRTTSRVTKLMTQIKNLNVTAVRGRRTVAGGIGEPDAYGLLKGFELNQEAILTTLLAQPYAVDTITGEITVNNLIPMNHVAAPFEATHMSLLGCWTRVDFSAGTYETFYSDELFLPIDTTMTDVVLTPSGEPGGQGTDFFLLKIGFQQEMGGNLYPLLSRACNALAIVEVV